MPNYAHIYRCRCANWTDNQIKVFTTSMAAPFNRIQHADIKKGVGLNDSCRNYVTWIRAVEHKEAIPESSWIKPKEAGRVTASAQYAGVVLGPHLIEHVFKGELNGATATGYHSKQHTNFAVGPPHTITHSAHRLAAFQVISRPDKYGVYYVGYKFSYTHQGQPATTAWKISTMFPDRLGQAAIVEAIKVASVNPRADADPSVDWAGLNDNNLRIGGRTTGNGAIKSAFPAYKGSFAIPDFVTWRFDQLP